VRDRVTLTFNFLTLSSSRTNRVTSPTPPRNLKTLRLFVHELWVITFFVDYHWKCERGHCACVVSRDPWIRGQKQLHFWNPRHKSVVPVHYTTIIWLRPRLRVVYARAVPWKWGPKMIILWKMVDQSLFIDFATTKRHFYARNRVVWLHSANHTNSRMNFVLW